MSRHKLATTILGVLFATVACEGTSRITSDEGGPTEVVANNTANNTGVGVGEPTPRNFECDPSQAAPEQAMRRLSSEQYRYTVRDLLTEVTGDEDLFWAVEDDVARLPDDVPTASENDTHGGYRRLDQALQQSYVDVPIAVGEAVGERLSESDARLESLMGSCATDADGGNDAACVEDFIRDFGMLAHRRTMTQEDVDFYLSVYDADGIDAAGVRDVVAVMMTSPEFLYQVEHAAEPVADVADTYELGAFELASRLSYHFWQSMPDRALLERAADGSLLDEAVYQAEVERVFNDPKTTRSVDRFMQEWLWGDEVPELNSLVGTDKFDTFAGENSPTEDLREHMVEELVQLGRYYAIAEPGSFQEMFASPYSFAVHDELAAIYGVPAWNGEGTPPEFPAEQNRRGLFTRAAFLSTGTTSTRPIIKGYFIRKGLMCTTPPPPDEAAANAELEITDDMTTREIVEELTEQPGTTCAGCHLTYLNDLGFPTESFDGLGRFRSEEMLFDEAGNLYGAKAIDTSAHPQIEIGTNTDVADADELTDQLLASGQLESCFARHYVRYTFGRLENVERDGCALEAVRSAVADGATLPQVMMGLAMRPEFKQRHMTATTE